MLPVSSYALEITMPAISINNVSFSYSTIPVLDRISLYVGDGERACLVGPNGCGKTTLLRIASGDLSPDQGTVTVSAVTPKLFQLPNVERLSGSVDDYLTAALHPLRSIATQFDNVTTRISGDTSALSATSEDYDQLLAQMVYLDIWALDARMAEVMAGLSLEAFIGSERGRDVSTLSPGQRARLQLAMTLIMKPGVLILDEPTNHLDSDAISFLTHTVKGWDGPVLMASHDRAFIEDTATVVYDMDVQVWNELAKAGGNSEVAGLYRCAGTYSDYLAEKTGAWCKYAELHATQQAEKRKLAQHRHAASTIARGGVRVATASGKAKKFFADRAASTAQRRIRNDDKRLDILTSHEVRKPRSYELSFRFAQPVRRSGIAVSVRQAGVKGRLAPVSFDLAHGEHLLVTGANGSGKTTLLNWIYTGAPPADGQASGTMSRSKAVSIVPQHLPTADDPGSATSGGSGSGVSADVWQNGIGQAGKGILHPSMWATPIAQLSAGNQRRAQIALAIASTPAILIIDEPTNYLDLDTMQVLEEALDSWTGTLIIASHDHWLIEHWHGRKIHIS